MQASGKSDISRYVLNIEEDAVVLRMKSSGVRKP
jgi:hypothetical protein